MKTRKEILTKFYEETIVRLEKEKGRWKHIKEVLQSFEIIQEEARQRIEALKAEAE